VEEGRYELAELFDTVLDLVDDLLAVPEVEGVETLVEVMSR